jgi:hypothetical protein
MRALPEARTLPFRHSPGSSTRMSSRLSASYPVWCSRCRCPLRSSTRCIQHASASRMEGRVPTSSLMIFLASVCRDNIFPKVLIIVSSLVLCEARSSSLTLLETS